MTRAAYVDESMRQRQQAGCYLLAAVIVTADDSAHLRGLIRDQLQGKQRRWHWRDERPARRVALLEATREVETLSAVVCKAMPSHKKQEQARSHCWWQLIPELTEQGVTDLVIEARQDRLNQQDRVTLTTIEKAGLLDSRQMPYRFAPATSDPLLWLADAIVGAIGMHQADGDSRYVEVLPQNSWVVRSV